jgi:N-acetylglutamate synthase-like GNAT family acetyltransferase
MTEETVRKATAADLPEIMRLLRMMWSEGGMFPLDEERAAETFNYILNGKGGVIGVIEGGDGIRAMIGVVFCRQWYTSHDHIEELFNYVRPDCRKPGTGYAFKLIRFARECSEKIGIPLLIGVLTNQRMEAKVRLYRRALGMPAGAFFVYGAKWMNEVASKTNIWHKSVRKRHGGKFAERVQKHTASLPLMSE